MHFDLSHGTFLPGQAYVAISRLRSLEGLTLGNPIHPYHVTQKHTHVKRQIDTPIFYFQVITTHDNTPIDFVSKKRMSHIERSMLLIILTRFHFHNTNFILLWENKIQLMLTLSVIIVERNAMLGKFLAGKAKACIIMGRGILYLANSPAT